MPLLFKRRSLIDLLNTAADEQERPKTSANLAPGRPRLEDERPKSEYGFTRSRLSHEVMRDDLPDPQDSLSLRTKRFSLLRMRNYSESHLSVRAREVERNEKEQTPPVPALPESPAVPKIMKTAPTMEHASADGEDAEGSNEPQRRVRPSLFKRSMSKGRSPARKEPRKSMDEKRTEKKSSSLRWRKLQGRSTGLEDLQRMAAAEVSNHHGAPPSYGDESNSALALPVPDHRLSESSRSDDSTDSADPIYGATTTTTHTVSTHTTFFRLGRRNKARNSLFPLPVKIPAPDEDWQQDGPPTPRASLGGFEHQSGTNGAFPNTLLRRHTETSPTKPILPTNAALAKSALSFAEPGGIGLFRNESQRSRASSSSSPLQPPPRLGMRDRASTTSSLGRSSHDMGTPPPMPGSGRNSTSTTGRSSLGGFLNLSRFRQSSDPHSPRYGSPGTGSKSNSFAMSREALVVPEREEGDTPSKYLERLEAAVARSMIATILSKSPDPFAQSVLRSYTRRFAFFGEPIDMSLRKFLLEAELPKETQQVDRVIQAFADRYHECNPGIFLSPDQAYIIAFSLMMLHTDAFNKNNKRKMQKQDYIRNTSGQHVSDDVLGCFYDNICYTPFVHFEEDVDINGERVLPFKPKKNKVKTVITETNKKPSGPVDPYNLLVDQKLDLLRPSIKDTISMEDPYDYKCPTYSLDPHYLQRAFTHTGTLQIISERSRPMAYEGDNTNSDGPTLMEMQPGIIDIKITKVGTLWRKATKKKKARSPWQEWGVILTGSQLCLFKNAHWAKGLVQQFNNAQQRGRPRTPVTFKPPLQNFKPDALIKTDNAVALVDSAYNRHKHAFTFIGPSGQDEVLLADNESELNDWLALINYAAAMRSAGVRVRGMLGGAEEDSRSREVRRLESTQSARSVQTTHSTASGLAQNRMLSPQLEQVMAARRQIMVHKVAEASNEISKANTDLDNLLRNARHLLVLAPITQKTRDDIIHAAARADASLKWARRAIWRTKCYKDILAMDVQQDGVSADEIEAIAEQQAHIQPESNKQPWPVALTKLTSRASAARSPPHSPTSPTFLKRPSTTGSLEAYTNDVFRTPSASATMQQQTGEWSLPPLQLDVQHDDQHRGSISSALLSTSSQGRNSVSQGSTVSSVRPNGVLAADEAADGYMSRPRAPSSVIYDPEIEYFARASMTPEPVAHNMGLDGATAGGATTTPESSSKHRSGVRRSLQKTLRDSHHHTGTIHKHRKGKDSDSTVRSATGAPVGTSRDGAASNAGKDKDDNDDVREGTPGLTREKNRFILHGKQASVVHFGTEWPNDRMRARREAWRQNSASSGGVSPAVSPGEQNRTPKVLHYGWGRTDVLGPSPHDFVPADQGEVQDAESTEVFIEHKSSPGEIGQGQDRIYLEPSDDEAEEEGRGRGKRGTVIGPPSRPQESGSVDDRSPSRSLSSARKSKRTTVIGPASKVLLAPISNGEVQAGVQRQMSPVEADDDFDDEDEEYTTPPSNSSNSSDDDADDVFREARTSVVVEGRA